MSKRASRRAKRKTGERRQVYDKMDAVARHGFRRPGTQNPKR